jgi:hypothetical protein
VRSVFEGQYLWLEASLNPQQRASATPRGSDQLLAAARTFARSVPARLQAWRSKVQQTAEHNKIALWGAGAKGVTFANLIDPQAELLHSVVDMNPNKQGNYLPGTGHPILSLSEAAAQGVRTVVIMNPNYLAESSRLVSDLDSQIDSHISLLTLE